MEEERMVKFNMTTWWNAMAGVLKTVNGKGDDVYGLSMLEILTACNFGFLCLAGFLRPFTRSGCLNLCLFGAYTAAPILVSNQLGIFTEGAYSPILMHCTFLLIIYANTDNINAFSLQDNYSNKRYMIQLLVFTFSIGIIFTSTIRIIASQHLVGELRNTQILWLLWIVLFFKVKERQRSFSYATRSGVAQTTRVLADFMRKEHMLSLESELEPASLKGYKYLVEMRKFTRLNVDPPSYLLEIEIKEAITVEQIWQCEGNLLSSTTGGGDADGCLKDLCLSFSLFWLLLRRYGGYPLYESKELRSKNKTWRFVREGLLRDDVGHGRLFQVIEVELKFLYDYFYTKYYTSYVEGKHLLIRFVMLIIVMSFVVWYVCFRGYYADPVLLVVVVVELVQFGILLNLEWTKVKFICYYVRNQPWKTKGGRLLGKAIQILCRIPNLKPWRRKLGQYSLLRSYGYNPMRYRLARSCIRELVEIPRPGQKESSSVKFSTDVKEALMSSLIINGPRLFNGVAALRRNQVVDDWPLKACILETQTHVILVWHIATSLCEMAYEPPTQLKDFRVAKHLSMYCAYLVAFTPELLPDGEHVTKFVFDQVILEAKDFFKDDGSCGRNKVDPYEKLMEVSDKDFNQTRTNLERGAILAKHLMSMIPDVNKRWKVLAEFWAEMLLFLAPSDNETAHIEYLAKGGELITHLWALLTHAGILQRDDSDLEVEAN